MKTPFLFGLLLCFSTLVFGQQKLEYGLNVGIFAGLPILYPNSSLRGLGGSTIIHSFSSSMDTDLSILAGITAATHFNAKGWQLKTGLDIHSFKYRFSTSSFTAKIFANTTTTRNTVVQLPLGYCKRWGHLVVYMGSGLTFFNIKDSSTEKEKASFEPIHNSFVKNTLDNFKTVYPFYSVSVGWRWQKSSIEIGCRSPGKLVKKDSNLDFNAWFGSRTILYLGTSLLLSKK